MIEERFQDRTIENEFYYQRGSADDSDDSSIDIGSLDLPERLVMGLYKKMEIGSYSTAFSGIDSPGTAYAQLRAATSAFLGKDHTHHPEHIHAIVPGLKPKSPKSYVH